MADGFLIGSALMSESNLELAIRKVILGDNKVCGLTTAKDAAVVYKAGAVYGGLIFVESSPRYITPVQARSIMAAAPLNWVGVFRNEALADVVNIAQSLKLFAVQLHGSEDDHYIKQLRTQLPESCQIWQAISVDTSLPNLNNPLVNRYVLDNGQGGTGQTFDWQLLQNQPLDNVILAGGINPDNVKQAMAIGVNGVDANSGIEHSPGVKDAHKIAELFTVLRSYPNLND